MTMFRVIGQTTAGSLGELSVLAHLAPQVGAPRPAEKVTTPDGATTPIPSAAVLSTTPKRATPKQIFSARIRRSTAARLDWIRRQGDIAAAVDAIKTIHLDTAGVTHFDHRGNLIVAA